MPILKEVYTTEPPECRKLINMITDTYDIQDIYISFGGKINNNDTFSRHDNNGSFHVIPSFLTSKNTHSLIVVFDLFTQPDYLQCYERIQSHITPHTHVILCNQSCEPPFIRKFIPYIINLARKIKCMPSNTVLCNYVKFKYQTNPIEQRYLEDIPTNIYAILLNPLYNEYMESFYEWFGYNLYLYNCIYKYKYYRMYHGAYSSLNLLYDTIKTIECDSSYQLCVSNNNCLNFWNYVYDITLTNDKLTSMYQDFTDDGIIKVTPYSV